MKIDKHHAARLLLAALFLGGCPKKTTTTPPGKTDVKKSKPRGEASLEVEIEDSDHLETTVEDDLEAAISAES